ncbi:MAG TPA: hypothetical protein VME86_11900 [Acidobacteriaceae bacterium]|nr:hypothetical protein [Acidobacteriaceae bacterium]
MNQLKLRRIFSQRFLVPALLMTVTCAAVLPAFARAEDQGQSSDHIVTPQALQQKVEAQSQTRQKNIATVQGFFKMPLAQRAMKMEHVDPAQVQKAIPTLSNAELTNLSARATTAQQQFSAGALSTETLLLIIIGMLFIVILVAIH